MKNKKNLLIVSSVIITSALLLSGCTDPAKSAAQKINLTKTTINGEATDLTNTTEKTNTKDSTNLERPKTMAYKELSDFKEIVATQAVFETTKGTLVMDLYRDKAPLTTANFLNLIDEGVYDNIVFHRVIPGFMAQVGDPFTKDPSKSEAEWGMGGPTYRIMDEFHPDLTHSEPGMLSMANSGPNTGGSQIFITYQATPHLDGKHAVFGKLVEGMDILESITKGDVITKASYR
jgi:cyclophilin family peptidyl-prolyl cis-trans isomerase